jgi:hypothetical protein
MINPLRRVVRRRAGMLAGVLALGITVGAPDTAKGQTASPSVKVASAAPCCSITAINLKPGIVTAVNEANQPFRFQVVLSDPPKGRQTPLEPINGIKLLRSLKVGQKVYVNFDTKKVSIDGADPCCSIIAATAHP